MKNLNIFDEKFKKDKWGAFEGNQSGEKQKPYTTQSETKYKEIEGLTIVYFVNQYKTDSKKEVIVAGITRRGIKPYIDIEPIKEKSELESEVKTDLEKEGDKIIFW